MALTAAVWVLSSAFTLVHLTPVILHEDELHFKQWMSQNNRVYGNEEFYQRLQIFTENKRRVERHNAGNHSYTMALNRFSDMTFEEFRKSFLMTQPQNCSATRGRHVSRAGPYPESIDWREKGNFVTPVKFQGHCGSCWTFSTTGCLESVNAIATGKLISLSEQQLVDCAQDFNNHGCNGGLPSQAFEYIKYSGGLMMEEEYPYKARDDVCHFDPARVAVSLRDVVNITSYDEKGMVDAVARLNPVTFSFDVTVDFLHYKGGVYSSNFCKKTSDWVNHAVLAVGYGVEQNGVPYWVVKNSWGTDWGNKGYFLIERGKNMCGLAACSSYPLPSV